MKKRLSETNNIRSTCLRLNMDIPLQQKAWAYLQEMDKKVFKSYNNIIAHAVVEYYDRYKQTQGNANNPAVTEHKLLQQIQDIVIREIKEAIGQIHKPDGTIIKPSPALNEAAAPDDEAEPQNKTSSIHVGTAINDTALDFIEGFCGDE